MSAADWIMHAATHNAPADRREWAHAMEAEFETLEKGKLGWALGCWQAMLGWRLRPDVSYLLALVSCVVFLGMRGAVDVLGFLPRSLVFSRDLWSLGLYPSLFIYMTLAAVLGAIRPNRLALTVAILVLAEQTFFVLSVGPQRVWTALLAHKVHIENTEPFVGVAALVGVCFIGCQIGIAINRLLKRKH